MRAERFTYLLHYARTGSQIWLAHLDLMRTFERAIMRAALPVAWSEGFNPRPDLVFALPVGVGIETRNEPFLIGLNEKLEAEEIRQGLNHVLPVGLTIRFAAEYKREGPSLMARVDQADYEIRLNSIEDYKPYLESTTPLMVVKHGKKKAREIDVRVGIRAFHFASPDRMTVSLAAGSQHNIRPDLFLEALGLAAGEKGDRWCDADIIRLALVLK